MTNSPSDPPTPTVQSPEATTPPPDENEPYPSFNTPTPTDLAADPSLPSFIEDPNQSGGGDWEEDEPGDDENLVPNGIR